MRLNHERAGYAYGPYAADSDDPVDARPTTDPPAPPPAGRMANFAHLSHKAIKRMRVQMAVVVRLSYVVYSPQATASQRGRD